MKTDKNNFDSKNTVKKHPANIDLADLIHQEMKAFFNDENYLIANKHFTPKEIELFKKSSFTKKKSAILTKLAENLDMSQSTFYHMLEGKNSQFDKIVNVLDFFDLELSYNISSKHETIYKHLDKETRELLEKISRLDKNKKAIIANLVDAMLEK